MAGDKRHGQKDPGPWLLMLEVLGRGMLSPGGWDGMSYVQSSMLRPLVVHTLGGSCCHGLCTDSSEFLLFARHSVGLCGHLLEVPSSVLKK